MMKLILMAVLGLSATSAFAQVCTVTLAPGDGSYGDKVQSLGTVMVTPIPDEAVSPRMLYADPIQGDVFTYGTSTSRGHFSVVLYKQPKGVSNPLEIGHATVSLPDATMQKTGVMKGVGNSDTGMYILWISCASKLDTE